MPQTNRNITTATTIPAPISLSISGTLTTSTTSDKSLLYTGTTNLMNFGQTPVTTGTIVEPIAYDGETGINNANTALNHAYTYLFIPSSGGDKLCCVLGIYQLSFDSNTGVYTYAITVDRDMAGLSGASFSIVFGKCVGWSIKNAGGAAATYQLATSGSSVTSLAAGGTVNEAQLAPSTQIGPYLTPLYIDASSTTVTSIENY